MNMKILKISFILIATVSFAGCSKSKLDPVPQTSLTEENAFKSPDRILGQVNQMYNAAKSGQFLGGRYQVYNDIRAEEFLNLTTNQVTASNTWGHTLNSSIDEVKTCWNAGYQAINRCNIVLDGVTANPTVIPTATADQYKAEAKFVRALCYFSLVTLYGQKPYTANAGASLGLPLRIIGEKDLSHTNLARSTVAQTYALILSDLNDAEAKLPANYSTPDLNVVRAQKNAAIALKTRVYLSMAKYPELITEANKIVSASAPFSAPTTGINHKLNPSFNTTFTNYVTTESIFSFPMTSTSAPGTQNGLATYYKTEYELNPAGILGDASWKATDARKSFITTNTAGKKFYAKFADDNNNYVPILRYAEVLLNLAEALTRSTNTVNQKAIDLLNAVRQRSDASTTFTMADFPTSASLVSAILRERRIELLSEGFRSMDILRQNIPIPGKGNVQAVDPASSLYVWPIPDSELLYNNLIVQN
jgi:hypothetical protein